MRTRETTPHLVNEFSYLAMIVCAFAPTRAGAAPVSLFTGHADFVSATGAADEPPIPSLGLVGRTGAVQTVGRLTYSVSQTDPDVALIFLDGNPINPGNEVFMSSVENLDVHVDAPVYGFGFFFVEGTDVPQSCNPQCPCADSAFEITLLLGNTTVGQLIINAPDDALAFFGVRSTYPFDAVKFRDQSGSCDNEYWGQFSLSDIAQCPADLANGSGVGLPDGGVDINDLLFFLASFESGANAADLDNGSGTGTPDGGVDINDLLFFLAHFEAGC